MLWYHKFRQDLFDPVPGRDVYVKRPRVAGGGRGWPEECPPIRAASAFGFDLLANFDVAFVRGRQGGWSVVEDVVIDSDFDYVRDEGAASDEAAGVPLTQQYAWFWERGQTIPHKISDDVYAEIRHQAKVSSFLFLRTEPNEMLLMTDVPNPPRGRAWRPMTALVETDWYPASYPWHCVIELDPKARRVEIKRGEVLCRVVPVRRDTYFAQPMSPGAFDDFFARGQKWLATHGSAEHEHAPGCPVGGDQGTVDITRTYGRQQARARFVVMP
jgi:hypothetical protein